MSLLIELASSDDLSAILALLETSGLPLDGFGDHLATALVARDGQRIVGSVALELYGTAALLRSVAVEEARRGQGVGQQLTRSALDLARRHGVITVYLLTETAERFFERFGFRPISRLDVAPAVQRSVEFTAACPESARAMVLDLTQRSQ